MKIIADVHSGNKKITIHCSKANKFYLLLFAYNQIGFWHPDDSFIQTCTISTLNDACDIAIFALQCINKTL